MVMLYGYWLWARVLDKYSKANTFVMKEKKDFKKMLNCCHVLDKLIPSQLVTTLDMQLWSDIKVLQSCKVLDDFQWGFICVGQKT